ncbi:MAG: membrane protein insertase YidC [Elusimicrobiota bacterium]|jgi:YidC/Oxa1 family membrane protein insertase|nr:membrane protein insertase YidC [Elusimicrobiota bacterium]
MNLLESFLKIIFEFFYNNIHFSGAHSYGLSIILLSISVNAILSPFYYLASKLEKTEKLLQSKLKPKIELINKMDNARLRHKQLSVLYSSYGYSPVYSLRSLSSLLIQIPFFIAAYQMLSNYKALDKVKFLFINNLGAPDVLLLGISILPILMTLINIASAVLITQAGSKERKQSYFIAVFFLVLLYMSPAGLVLYWTCNNLINFIRYFVSYVKNNGLSSLLKSLVLIFKNIVDSGYAQAFCFFTALYFAINILSSQWYAQNEYVITILSLPLYFAVILQTYDFIRLNSSFNFAINCQAIRISFKTHKKNLFKCLCPIFLLSIISLFVYKYEQPHYLSACLIFLAIYNLKNIKVCKLKEYMSFAGLTIAAMLLPALIYLKANFLYFYDYKDIVQYIFILMSFAIILPVISVIFNHRLSLENNKLFSISFILAAMFMPLVNDLILYYSSGIAIGFIIVFLMVIFVMKTILRYKKILLIFLLSASLFTLLTIVNEKRIIKPTIIVPQELLDMKMKGNNSIYLFMHDAFPRKDLALKAGLKYDALEKAFNDFGFTIYDVYSIQDATLRSMASLFNMTNMGGSIYGEHGKLLKNYMNGDNIVNFLLRKNGWKMATVGNEPLPFADITLTAKSNSLEEEYSINNVFKGIMQGRLDTSMLTIKKNKSSSATEIIAQFANKQSAKNNIFAWAMGPPGHTSPRAISDLELDFKVWKDKYNNSIEIIKKELELTAKNSNDIIIFMSDHGPWALGDHSKRYPSIDEKNIDSLYFRDHFGAFMAIRWPDKARAAKYDKEFYITQDLFPIVLSYLYDSPIPLKYRIKDTAVRIKSHKFDKGVFYPYFYKNEEVKK